MMYYVNCIYLMSEPSGFLAIVTTFVIILYHLKHIYSTSESSSFLSTVTAFCDKNIVLS